MSTTIDCSIARLIRPEHAGDWHDKPLKWGVYGPMRKDGTQELQKFATKKGALEYRSRRRKATSEIDAIFGYNA